MGWTRAPDLSSIPCLARVEWCAVSSGRPVIAQDVVTDTRYLTTIAGTRGEMIQPVFGSTGAVVGTIDVEADRVNAFTARDEDLLRGCAEALRWLWA